ncbi:MAG: DUF1800 family protein [Cyclobacteriaceae bacterium]
MTVVNLFNDPVSLMPLTPLVERLGRKRAAHLLRRACFGATKSQIDEFSSMTAIEANERLFDNDIPDPALPIDPLTGSEWITSGTTDANSEDFALGGFLMDWWIGNFMSAGINEAQSLSFACRERLVFFLHTLITTKSSSAGSSRNLYYQLALFRFFAFDKEDHLIPGDPDNQIDFPDRNVALNLAELTKKVSVDNAMLQFLDGRLNVKGSPNENYGRELLELYSIGRGLEGSLPSPEFDGDYFNYTEEDVQQAARVLSGFTTDNTFSNIDEDTNLPRGIVRGGTIASSHDNDAKTFSVRFNNHTISPDATLLSGSSPTEASVLDEISQLVDMIYSQRETARHIMRKIYRFYVYHEIDEATQNGIIEDLTDLFLENNFKLQPVLEALFSSQEFYEGADGVDDNKFGSVIKSPIDLVVGLNRSLEIAVPDMLTETESFYEHCRRIRSSANSMGLDLYEPFEVAGYAAYHQFPGFNRNWINTNYLTNRYNYVRNLLEDGITSTEGKVDLVTFVRNNWEVSTIRNSEQFILEVITYLLPVYDEADFTETDNGELTNSRLNYFRQQFLEQEGLGATGAQAWNDLWDDANFNNAIAGERLSFLFNAILQTPEFQLM